MITFQFSLTYLEIYVLLISFSSFSLYGYDKLKALDHVNNPRRISEFTLLTSSLLGGTVGSIMAMLFFRHKIKKISFLIKFTIIIFIQVALIYIYINYRHLM
ncbi:DUF1294 domain-containing protein [Sulfurimonas sp.]|uniref:DUF1294 domain-containing protein n=1 Tax=Sulfurimonas sp. TaxID=2022749 RepID=UPI0039E5D01C